MVLTALTFEPRLPTPGLSRLDLPGGVRRADGTLATSVTVRALTGRDEEVLGSRHYENAVDRVTDFLAGVIVDVGGAGPLSREQVERLLIGDRDFLILRLRQMALGDVVEQVLRCPALSCGQRVDVEFRISELEVRTRTDLPEWHELTLSVPAVDDDPTSTHAALRLPTGADQREVGRLAEENPSAANTRLFSLILRGVGSRERVSEELVRAFPLLVRREITHALARLSPGPQLDIEVPCPYCGQAIAYPLDVQRFFFDEWLRELDRLYEEVHALAFHYHWAEESILAMPRHKRSRYLTLLADAMRPRSSREFEA